MSKQLLRMWKWKYNFVLALFWISLTATLILGDNLALLSGTLRTYQKAACDDEHMTLRCPTGTTISIGLAQYGKVAPAASLCQSSSSRMHPDLLDNANVTCLWPPAIQAVVGLCQKKPACKFETSPRTFGGDPCPGSRKYVEVAYKCRPSEFKSLIGCEDDVLQLKCNRSSRLAIYSASFGRTEYESVQCPQPKGVPEESCLSSYATETVMQMCHGKRSCALGADATTFGHPCKPESRMYLKVIHTCVPRKVLKEKYQGELEPDEMPEDENDEETTDPFSSVKEQPSIYSPDHSKSWAPPPNPKSTVKPHQTSLNQSPEANGDGNDNGDDDGGRSSRPRSRSGTVSEENQSDYYSANNFSNHDHEDTNTNSNTNANANNNGRQSSSSTSGEMSTNPVNTNKFTYDESDIRVVYLLSEGVQAYEFVLNNSERVYLYVAISIAAGLLMLVLLLLLKVGIQHKCGSSRAGADSERGAGASGSSFAKPSSSSSVGPLTSTKLSDIDDLSVVMMDPGDIVDLHSIMRRSATPRDELFPLASCSSSAGGTGTTTLGRNSEVVCFSNSRSSDLLRHSAEDETDMNHPRSLNFNREHPNIHYYYG